MTTSSPVGSSPAGPSTAHINVDTLRFGSAPEANMVLEGHIAPADAAAQPSLPPLSITLRGSRHSSTSPVVVDGERWSATIALTASRWGGPQLALPSATYTVSFLSGEAPVSYSADAATLPARTLIEGVCAVTATARNAHGALDSAALSIHVAAPLTEAEFGPKAQARLEAAYRAGSTAGTAAGTAAAENAIFFESFYGHNVSCNPLGIDRAVAELLPEVTRYWSVIDASVAVPEGAVAIIEGSEQWWRVRGAAKLLVVNDWLRKRFARRPHQKVLQTWHGTPLKKIALSRPGLRLRPALASIRERGMWNILLAQNDHSARTIRRAYAYTGPVWQEGYPRNDVLVTRDAAAIRRSLGIPHGVTVLLYAPTWRDDRPGHVDHLDVAAFAETLGSDYVTLIRGHSRSITPGTDVHGHRVLDVTSYPDISDLFLVADALITDYSSVMFDFSVTGKPLYFFAPDLDHYRAQLRGFYFDLGPVAPGPVVQDPAELVELVTHPDAVQKEFAERYTAWQERFNPHDDGNAGHRVVARLVAQGILS
jgi:CDP-glycerol glycerophosphotransferase